jgi:hypothetical protein
MSAPRTPAGHLATLRRCLETRSTASPTAKQREEAAGQLAALDAVCAEVERLRADAARLDWLNESRVVLVPQWFEMNGAPAWRSTNDMKYGTLRGAIDAAMTAARPEAPR